MKKNFKLYAVVWAISLALFQVIAFVTPGKIAGISKFAASFWIGYGFITAAFLGHLLCAYLAFRADSLKRFFYNVSLILISYTGLVILLIVGGLCMAIPVLPYWVGVIVCVLVVGFTAIATVMAQMAVDTVTAVDEKVKAKTFFIRSLAMDAEGLMARAKSDAVKAECKKVFEALRYSDPMSSDALAGVESQITLKFNEFSEAVTNGVDTVSTLADKLVILIRDRNRKCKLLK